MVRKLFYSTKKDVWVEVKMSVLVTLRCFMYVLYLLHMRLMEL